VRAAFAVLVAALLVLTGWGSLADPLPFTNPGSATPAVVEVAEPTTVRIPKLDVSSSLTRTGWADQPGGELAVPPVTEPMQASWFDEGGRPGMAGYPAVILGHVSGRPAGATRSVPGVFAKLGDLARGDAVVVDRADGSSARFVVQRVERYCKNAADVAAKRCDGPVFDEAAVYDDTPTPTLRLITCGGEYDASAHNFLKNVVVFAAAVPVA
jgi:hypothetical protein